MSGAYYNEFDPDAAAWLEELIRQGHIAPGQVDTRSIEDVRPDDLRGFTQCHFFAGIGVWSYALRRAGWPDDRPVWTGSCPCQPFSAAGKGAAFDDERHLWPAFHHLIKVGRPPSLFGEQVASSIVDDWIDLVHADLETLGYAFGSVPFPSAGVGAPHIRDRNYWMAHANDSGWQRRRPGQASNGRDSARFELERLRYADGLAHSRHDHDAGQGQAASVGQSQADRSANQPGGCGVSPSGLADANGKPAWRDSGSAYGAENKIDGQGSSHDHRLAHDGGTSRPGPTNGFWRDADWLGCRDGKWRPVEPGSFPLAYGLPTGMGKLSAGAQRLAALAGLDAASLKRAKSHRIIGLRGAGNAINAEAAIAWIETVMECIA